MANNEEISSKICLHFGNILMPPKDEFLPKDEMNPDGELLSEDIEKYRNGELMENVGIFVQQELYRLSPQFWLWFVPRCMNYYLSGRGEITDCEFLIYYLSPNEEFKSNAKFKLHLFDGDQILCIISFLKWCYSLPNAREYFEERLLLSINFLENLRNEN